MQSSVTAGRPDLAAYNQQQDFLHSSPYVEYQYVDVTFPSGANTNYDIPHALSPPTPEDIDFVVVKKDRACDIYYDATGTRRAWGDTYIVLRSSVASAVVTLLLTVRRT